MTPEGVASSNSGSPATSKAEGALESKTRMAEGKPNPKETDAKQETRVIELTDTQRKVYPDDSQHGVKFDFQEWTKPDALK